MVVAASKKTSVRTKDVSPTQRRRSTENVSKMEELLIPNCLTQGSCVTKGKTATATNNARQVENARKLGEFV